MEKIINNPGLQHLAEKVFWNLGAEDLKICRKINQSSKHILEDGMFWLRKFRSLSKVSQKNWIKIIESVKNSGYKKVIVLFLQWYLEKDVEVVDLPCAWFKKRILLMENQNDWIKVIESVKNSEEENAIMSYLKWNLKNIELDNLPCYTSHNVQVAFKKKISEICQKKRFEFLDEDTEIANILIPLTDNPNAPAPDKFGITPIHWAAHYGHTEIVKILVPFTEHPNVSDKEGATPISWAARNGHTEIVKMLVPLVDNPNAPDKIGRTPIHWAANYGHTEIVKMLDQFDRKS